MRYRVEKKCGVRGEIYDAGMVVTDGVLPEDAVSSLKLWGAISDFPEGASDNPPLADEGNAVIPAAKSKAKKSK